MPTRSEFEADLLSALWKAKDEDGLVDCGMEGLAAAAAALAEKRGLRFDPEPVKLPGLEPVMVTGGRWYVDRRDPSHRLTESEALEVIRRARVHEELLDLATLTAKDNADWHTEDICRVLIHGGNLRRRLEAIGAILRGDARPAEAEAGERFEAPHADPPSPEDRLPSALDAAARSVADAASSLREVEGRLAETDAARRERPPSALPACQGGCARIGSCQGEVVAVNLATATGVIVTRHVLCARARAEMVEQGYTLIHVADAPPKPARVVVPEMSPLALHPHGACWTVHPVGDGPGAAMSEGEARRAAEILNDYEAARKAFGHLNDGTQGPDDRALLRAYFQVEVEP